MSADIKHLLRERAKALGFIDARVAPAVVPDAAAAAYKSWLNAGFHGEMEYMARLTEERAAGADHVLAGARSVIVLAASYWYPSEEQNYGENGEGTRVRVAKYALGKDYHYVLKERMAELIAWLDRALPGEQWRACVDSAPLLERSYAAAAGIGFIGKNGMLISWLQGSYTFLAEIVTTADIQPDEPRYGTCGNCTRCLDACPTQAFAAPGVVDARRCISYLTIEKRSDLTENESASTGEWVFGCDVCQDVCPYNKTPITSSIEEFRPGTLVEHNEPVATFLDAASNRQFERRFTGSPLLRPGRKRLQKLASQK